MQVAQTILQQLGGNKFLAMTGARDLAGSNDALQFRLPARFARDGINVVRVRLNAADLYDVTFYRMTSRGLRCDTVAAEADVYADQLRARFEAVTGLRCTL